MKTRVLVIDDTWGMRDVLEAILKRSRFEVELAESSEQAMRLYIDHAPFDVVLTDPTGLEFAHFLKNTNPSQPMVFMSATEDVVQAQREQFTFVMQKPFEVMELVDTLEDAINNKRKQAH